MAFRLCLPYSNTSIVYFPCLTWGAPKGYYRMTNFDLPRRLNEQIILVLTTTNSIPAENKGDYSNFETKTKHDKKSKNILSF